MRILFTFFSAFVALLGFGQSLPQVAISSVLVNESDLSEIQVSYNLQSDLTDSVEVHVFHSGDAGSTWSQPISISGDFGKPVSNGSKLLTYESAEPANSIQDIKVRLVAVSRFSPSIQSMVDEVDQQKLIDVVSSLEGPRNYGSNPSRMDSIKDYLEDQMQTLLPVRLDFSYNSIAAQNIVADHEGVINPRTVVVNGAHFDGVASSPAADDNATGVAGVLEALRILAGYQFEHSIRFLLFDLEELGLRGSRDYVLNDLSPEDSLIGVLVNEMIGYADSSVNAQQFPTGFNILFPTAYNQVASDSFRGDFITNVGNTNSASLMAAYSHAAQLYVPMLEVVDVEAPGNSTSVPDLRRSDHAPFWDAGYKALMLTDGANFRNPHYHELSDSLETIDFNFMTAVVKANVATLAELAVPIIAGSAESTATGALSTDRLHGSHIDCFQILNRAAQQNASSITFKSCIAATDLNLWVTDVHGRNVEIENITQLSSNTITVQLAEGAAGMYLLMGKSNEGQFMKKVILNR